ncbi:Hypothetical predicted protein [Lecanosticta acicola]|uniref:Uncharacterized protein n=1 Tax=Lecanosticta acicola TaxID=111012 RepID=A0AAI8Z8X5_9PEZI|nr:Hypothetical predicted protein [Lecanosticta acicola]
MAATNPGAQIFPQEFIDKIADNNTPTEVHLARTDTFSGGFRLAALELESFPVRDFLTMLLVKKASHDRAVSGIDTLHIWIGDSDEDADILQNTVPEAMLDRLQRIQIHKLRMHVLKPEARHTIAGCDVLSKVNDGVTRHLSSITSHLKRASPASEIFEYESASYEAHSGMSVSTDMAYKRIHDAITVGAKAWSNRFVNALQTHFIHDQHHQGKKVKGGTVQELLSFDFSSQRPKRNGEPLSARRLRNQLSPVQKHDERSHSSPKGARRGLGLRWLLLAAVEQPTIAKRSNWCEEGCAINPVRSGRCGRRRKVARME